ncbi:hypothetical protein QYF36_016307 [Acer negundo]|nr:hypothetical protein QYF36_016307 [Acer negundo]
MLQESLKYALEFNHEGNKSWSSCLTPRKRYGSAPSNIKKTSPENLGPIIASTLSVKATVFGFPWKQAS